MAIRSQGAERGDVYSTVMRQAGRLTAIAIVLGLVSSITVGLIMRNLLFGVAAWDIPTLAGVAFLLSVASFAASFIPARRAASINPGAALRSE